jgi:hypothetical protein
MTESSQVILSNHELGTVIPVKASFKKLKKFSTPTKGHLD